MGVYSTAMESVEEYLGLSPTAFFTILVMMIVVYNTVSGMFVYPEEEKDEKPSSSSPAPPVEAAKLGDMTEEELRAYDGSDPTKPLLMAIKGQIYDVSASRMFYGPGGPYAMFAGRDASRALALMSFDPQDLTGETTGLSESELEVLQDWEYKFMEKYTKIGHIVSNPQT